MRAWMTTEAKVATNLRRVGTAVPKIARQLGRSDHSVYAFLRYNHVQNANTEAVKRSCPVCGAKRGDRCFLARQDRGDGRRKSFHRERFPR